MALVLLWALFWTPVTTTTLPGRSRCDKLERKWERNGHRPRIFFCGNTFEYVPQGKSFELTR